MARGLQQQHQLRALLLAFSAVALLILACGASVASAEKRMYFWNKVSNEVQWEDPGKVPHLDPESGKKFWVHPESGDSVWENPHHDEHEWQEFHDEEHDRPYYVHKVTEEATWETPYEHAWQRVEQEVEL